MAGNKNATCAGKFIIGQDCASVVTGFVLKLMFVIAGYIIGTTSLGGKSGWTSYKNFRYNQRLFAVDLNYVLTVDLQDHIGDIYEPFTLNRLFLRLSSIIPKSFGTLFNLICFIQIPGEQSPIATGDIIHQTGYIRIFNINNYEYY